MSSTKQGKIVLVEVREDLIETDVFESKLDVVKKLIKIGSIYNCEYGSYEHFSRINDLIYDLEKVKSCLKSEIVSAVDYPSSKNKNNS